MTEPVPDVDWQRFVRRAWTHMNRMMLMQRPRVLVPDEDDWRVILSAFVALAPKDDPEVPRD